jgi:sarcosine oxidase subunit delta
MRIPCPLCGERDRREFTYYGAADWLARPAEGTDTAAFARWLHDRDNPAGETEDLWYHEQGCTAWLRLRRDTVTHAILSAALVAPVPPAGPAPAGKPARKRKSAEAPDAA